MNFFAPEKPKKDPRKGRRFDLTDGAVVGRKLDFYDDFNRDDNVMGNGLMQRNDY